MKNSCLRCGRCCTQFGVCVTSFDVKRISEATGLKPEEFLDLIPDYKERERTEPAILIDGEYSILVLKRQIDDKCFFFSNDGCSIYKSRPMLCRTYPFRVQSPASCSLKEMKSRDCIESWTPDNEEKKQYVRDCKKYELQVEEYNKLVQKWNKKGGSFSEFLKFIS